MKAVFGALSLLVVVAIIAILAKKQLGAAAPASAPSPTRGADGAVIRPTGNPNQQVQQFEQAVQGAVQQARPMPEDK